jgi:long-chain fatty acid transport protein
MHKYWTQVSIASCILFFLAPKSYSSGSGGISNEVTSASSLSNVLIIAGSNEDPTVTYHNPSSIGNLGKYNASIGAAYFNFSAKHSGPNGSDKMKTTNAVIPNFSATQSFNEGKFGIGLAVLSPYGLSTEWSDTSNVRYVATKSELKMINVTPAISYRPTQKFALGIGAVVNSSRGIIYASSGKNWKEAALEAATTMAKELKAVL